MTEKTQALALRMSPFSRTSRMVTWLTPDFGRLVTLIKGACRPKSMFLGQCDLFYTCELVFYMRDRNGVHIAKECVPLETRPAFRADWRASACAVYLCDLASGVSLHGHGQHELYDLITSALDALCSSGGEKRRLLFWFEIQLMRLLGVSPQLSACTACGNAVQPSAPAFFSAKGGGILCKSCRRERTGDSTPIGNDVLAILRTWQTALTSRPAQTTRCSEGQLTALNHILDSFLKYHLDRVPESRYTVLQTLAFQGHQLGDR